jgi:NADPH:quinone reductase
MKAIVIRQFGNPSVLSYEDVPDPEPGEGEVRIAVRAAGTNPVDAGNRADGTWAGITLPWVPGYELSGVIDRVGPATGNWKLALGQRVVTMTDFPRQGGGYAELAVVAAGSVALLADSVPFAAAAATPVAGGTAWEILERLRLGAGARLLVLGSSGGVGSYLLQLAALRGIATVAVGRREQHERLRQLGAAACLDYVDGQGAEDLRRAGQGPVDAVAGRAARRRPDRLDRDTRARPRLRRRSQRDLPRDPARPGRPPDPRAGRAPVRRPAHQPGRAPAAAGPGSAGPPPAGDPSSRRQGRAGHESRVT